ncbi:MAG: TolC family protein [Candidatus Eisenbacteria bacterium]|nr:TolC family protein [Candidatus Eisenbacteria bacterium]
MRRLMFAGLAPAALLGALAAPVRAQVLFGPAPTPDSFTVAECVRIARATAPDVQIAIAVHDAARFDSTAASRNRRPSFAFTGGATVAPAWSYDPALTNLGDYSLKLGMDLPLADGGARRRERAAATLAVVQSRFDRDRIAREAGLRAAALALDLLQHRDQEAYARASLQWLERLATLIESGVRGGGDRADAVRVRIAVDAVVAQISVLTEEQGMLMRELSQVLGRDPATPLRIVGSDSIAVAVPSTVDSLAWLERARDAPEVRAAYADAEGARIALEQAVLRGRVTVDLAADAGLAGSDLTRAVPEDLRLTNPDATFADRLRRDLGASVSLQFHRPILDRTASRAVVNARQAELRAAGLRAAAALGERRRVMMDLLGRWRAAAERLTLSRASVARADDHVLRLRSQYAGGASSLLEVLDARRQLDDARTRLADARLATGLAQWEGELRR